MHRLSVALALVASARLVGAAQAQGTGPKPRPAPQPAPRRTPRPTPFLYGAYLGTGGFQERRGAQVDAGIPFGAAGQVTWRRLSVRLRGEGLFLPGQADSAYHRETNRNGDTVCRDVASGRFSSSNNCSTRTVAAGAAEADYAVPVGRRFVAVGGGARVGYTPGPYGAVTFLTGAPTDRHLYVRGFFGPRAGGVTAGFMVRL